MERQPLIDYSVGSNAFFYTILSFTAFFILRIFNYKQIFYGSNRTWRTIKFHTLEVVIDRKVTIKFQSSDGGESLITQVATTIPEYVTCDIIQGAHSLVIDWRNYAKLTIKHNLSNSHTYDFHWEGYRELALEDHVMMMDDVHWYGVGHTLHQPWPLERWYTDFGAFVVKETPPFATSFGEVQERMWINSSGVALFVDFEVPLFASINCDYNKTIKLRAEYKSPYQNNSNTSTFLRYSLIQTQGDVKSAFQSLRERHIPLPEGIPDEKMFRYPIWSTWAQCKKNVTQDKVITYAKVLQGHRFKAAQIEIDDDWTPHYGDWKFDKKKFPDPKLMMKTLKDLGFRVMLWVHPFASPQSAAFREGMSRNTWIQWKMGRWGIPAIVSWWNGYGALLDVTDPSACQWFRRKLQDIKEEFGIDSFKVDAGEAGRLSTWTRAKQPMDNPNTYTKLFAELTYSLDTETRAQEIRVGVGVQHLPMFFRLQDKDSNWTSFNGIKTVIPHVLTQGLIGYPFVLPDMIGGNAYFTSYPDRELFIRWVQLTALMPAMQFSIGPWTYGDEETVLYCQKMCQLHEEYSDKIISLAKEATQTGAPIIRPLWWIAPTDEAALTISSEFLLGDDVLVAPVLEHGARSRDVYLTAGRWRDQISNNELDGGKWYKSYPAELDQLLHFVKI